MWGSGVYAGGVARVLRVAGVAVVLYVGLIGLTGFGFNRIPSGFVPTQDKQYLVAFAQLPDASTLDRTDAVIRKMSAIAMEHPAVDHSVAFPGLSVNGFVNVPNAGINFVVLKPFEERKGPGMDANSVVARLECALLRRDSGGVRRDLPAAAGAGARHGRRFQALRRRSRQPRLRGALRAAAGQPGQGPDGTRACRTLFELPGERAAGGCAGRSRTGQRPTACRSATSTRRCRSTSARSMSTTSTASAAPTR